MSNGDSVDRRRSTNQSNSGGPGGSYREDFLSVGGSESRGGEESERYV